MESKRKSVGGILIGSVTLIVVVVAVIIGIVLSSGSTPPGLSSAARATLDASSYTATTTVLTALSASTVSSSAVRSRRAATFRAQYLGAGHVVSAADRSRLDSVIAALKTVMHATGVQRRGSTYSFSMPASRFVEPGLSTYARNLAQAEVAVTVSGGYVRSILVDELATPSFQVQHITFSRIGSTTATAVTIYG